MSLADIMGNAGLSGYAEVALVIFLLTFVAIVVRTYSKSNRALWEHARQLPLDDAEPAPRVVPQRVRGELP